MIKQKKERDGDYLEKRYLMILGGFVLVLLVILLLGGFMGQNFNFADAGLDQFQPMGGNLHVAMVRREYNPEQELMRLDFLLEDAMSTTRLSNLEFETEVRYISGTRPLSIETIQVNDHFVVMYIENLPQNFGVLSVTLTPHLIHPELHGSFNLSGAGIRMYVNEADELLNLGLMRSADVDHQRDHISVEKRFLRAEISEKEEAIYQHEFSISFLQDAIDRLQSEMQYMTRSEQEIAYQTITGHEASIANHERNISDLSSEVEELQERIVLLEQRKQGI